MKAWTDYPFVSLGDTPGQEAPVRECELIAYDGDKYVTVIVDGKMERLKYGYVYQRPGRQGEVDPFKYATLARLPEDLGIVK